MSQFIFLDNCTIFVLGHGLIHVFRFHMPHFFFQAKVKRNFKPQSETQSFQAKFESFHVS